MKIQDGFIVGIFNYCDRWCERCPHTHYCRMYEDLQVIDADDGAGLRESRMTRERRRLTAQLIEWQAEAEEVRAAEIAGGGEPAGHLPPGMEASDGPDPEVVARGAEIRQKMRQLELSSNPTVRLASETIRYFALFVPTRMMRALSQVARGGGGDVQSDANGSAKVALLALDRMESAWNSLIETHHVSASMAAPFLAEIARMKRNLDRALPNARAFIRPAFDEPDEVKMLNVAKC